jgi:Cna protein B-type domain.
MKKYKKIFTIFIVALTLSGNSVEIFASSINNKEITEIQTEIEETTSNIDNLDEEIEEEKTEQQAYTPNTIELTDVYSLMKSVSSDAEVVEKIDEISGEELYSIKLADDLFLTVKQTLGTLSEIIDKLQSEEYKGETVGESRSRAYIGHSWDVPILHNVIGEPVYCVDGRLSVPASGGNWSFGSVGGALGGAYNYIYSNMNYGYPRNFENGLIGSSFDRQLGTGAAIWYNMARYRANPSLDWGNPTAVGSGGYSAYHENSNAGANMRYLVDKGNHVPTATQSINGQTSGTVMVDRESDLEIIDGVEYQVSEWYNVGNGTIYFNVPDPLKMQRQTGIVYNAGNHNCEAGGSFRILNPDLTDNGSYEVSTTSSIKKTGFLLAITGVYNQDVVMGVSEDPITSPSIKVNWFAATGSVEIPKSHQNMPSSFVYNYNNYSIELFDNTGTSIDTKTIAPSITSESKIVFDNLLAGNYYAIETINNPNVVAIQNRVDFTIVAGQTTVVSKANGFINTLAIGSLEGTKLITTNANPDVIARYDLTQVVANIRSEDGTYNQNHNFDINGNLQVTGLTVGKYYITEVSAPIGLTLDASIIEVTVTSNATVYFTFNNEEEVGNLRIVKKVNKTTTNEINHDYTKIKLRIESLETHIDYDKTFYMNANGTLEINNLPIGIYKITELEVPSTMKLNVVSQTVTIINKTTIPVEIINNENTANVNIKKKVTNNTNAITNDDLTEIEIRVRSLDAAVKYDRTFNLNANGELLLTNLAFARYEVTEVNCPSYMKKDTTVHIINANIDGRTYQVEFENIISAGVLKIDKDISKTTNNDVTINHDFTQVKIRIESQEQYITYSQDFYLNAAGTITVNNLPIGKYKITELEVPETMQLTATPQIVEVVEGITTTAKGIAKLVNTESLTHIRVKKAAINPTTIAALPIDYTKIAVRIVSTTTSVKYDRTFNLNANGELEVRNLAYATYTVAEVSCPDYMEMDTTIHTIVSTSHNKTYEVGFENILIASKVKVAKDNSDGGTMPGFVFGMYRDILRWEDGTPKVFGIDATTQTYKTVAEPKGTLVNALNQLYYQGDETTRIFGDLITGADGTFTTAEFPYQFKNVWVQELATPPSSYVYLDYMLKQVALVPGGTASVKFIDIIKRPGMLQINKRNEDGAFVAWYFDIYAQYPNTTEKIYLETISTSGLDGIGRSTMLQLVDSNGEKIKLFVKEQAHTLYATSDEFIEVTDEMWNSGKSIFILDINNIYKRLNLKGFKIMLENTTNAIADGAEFTLFNNLDEEIGTAVVKNNEFVFIDLRADIITKEMYILETKTPAAAIPNPQKIMLPDIDLDNVQDGDTVLINSKDSPIINEPTITEFTKVDVTGEEEVCGAKIELLDDNKVIAEGVSCETDTTFTGLDRGKEYTIRETLIPAGYQRPLINEVDFIVEEDGSITHVTMKNELTKLIYHKLEGTVENPTGNYVAGAEIGVRLISRPDVKEVDEETSTNNAESTNNIDVEEAVTQYDIFSNQITPTTEELTKLFLNAKIDDTVFTFITTGGLQEFYGIPVGFEIEFYEIKAPIGYEFAEPVFITIPETGEAIVKQFDDLTIFELPKTGDEFLIIIILGSGLLLSSSAYIAVMIVAKKYHKLYELEMKLRKKIGNH